MPRSLFGLVLYIAVAHAVEGAGPKCFQCKSVPFPRDCNRITKCGDHEECGIDEVITSSGNIVYDVGCKATDRCLNTHGGVHVTRHRRGDITTCTQCCKDDYCNSHGCGAAGIDVAQRGPYCFTCDYQVNPSSCEHVQVCQPHEFCLIYQQDNFAGVLDRLFTSRCARVEQCTQLQKVHWGKGHCATCCTRDFCNVKCNRSTTIVPHVPAVPPTILPLTTTAGVAVLGCFSNHAFHPHGSTWNEGCKYKCTCVDGRSGLYNCNTLCLGWTLPSECMMIPPAPGKCCSTPSCPPHITIQYPSGYSPV